MAKKQLMFTEDDPYSMCSFVLDYERLIVFITSFLYLLVYSFVSNPLIYFFALGRPYI